MVGIIIIKNCWFTALIDNHLGYPCLGRETEEDFPERQREDAERRDGDPGRAPPLE